MAREKRLIRTPSWPSRQKIKAREKLFLAGGLVDDGDEIAFYGLFDGVEAIRTDASKQIESNIESLMGLFPVASSTQVKRLERKVATLTRKVNALEKAKVAKTAPPSAGKTEAQASA